MTTFNQILITYKSIAQENVPATTAMEKVRAIHQICKGLKNPEPFKRAFIQEVLKFRKN